MGYKLDKNGAFVAVKSEKAKEESTAKKFDAKIAELQAEIAEKDKTIAALETEKADYIAAKDAEIMDLEKAIDELRKK